MALREGIVQPGLATYQDVCMIYGDCPSGKHGCSTSWRMLAQSHPQVWQFWQRHPRMYSLPPRHVEVEGSHAVVTGFRSTSTHAGLDVVTLRNSLQVLGVHPVLER
jgi:hypothetical protein